MKNNNQKKGVTPEDRLQKIKDDFIELIPQLKEIQEVQKAYLEVQKEKRIEGYPFINTQSFSTN